MNARQEIKIPLLSGSVKAWLQLQGTILSYRERSWSRECTVDIPIELITVSEWSRFKGIRLIAALLSLIFLPGIGGAVIGLWKFFTGSVPAAAISVWMGTSVIAGLIAFLLLLAMFFIRQPTITIHISPRNTAICFWLEKRQEAVIRDMIDSILSRKSTIAETITFPMRFAVGDAIQQPWKRTVILTFLFLIPAFTTEIPWLLFAGIIPICLHIYSAIRETKEPQAFRQASRLIYKREWNQARDIVRQLIITNPAYRPARLRLIELLVRLDDFDGAQSALASIQSELDTEMIQQIQQDIIVRRRVSKRKKE
jgi:hypothetical protein